MNCKEGIVKMIEKIKDEEVLNYIFIIIRDIINEERQEKNECK